MRKILYIIVLPILITWTIGTATLGNPLWPFLLDYSNEYIMYFVSHILFFTVGMSACIKFTYESVNKRKR